MMELLLVVGPPGARSVSTMASEAGDNTERARGDQKTIIRYYIDLEQRVSQMY